MTGLRAIKRAQQLALQTGICWIVIFDRGHFVVSHDAPLRGGVLIERCRP